MVVDDDDDIRSMVRILLELSGYEVVEASSGEECLENYGTVRPNLILLDINMTGIDGWEVCRQIKEMKNDGVQNTVPVAIMTSRTSKEDVRKSLEYAHADVHLKKPISIEKLRDTVKTLLGECPSS